MNKKIFENARFCPKGDIEANWNKANGFIPLNKEIIIYKPDENHSAARFKIGDGKTKVQDLPFSGTNIDEIQKLIDEKGQLLIEYVDNAVSAIEIPQPDWNQQDENAADYIKNKPFGEKNFFEPITWDGVVGYKEKVDVSALTSYNAYAVKVSDAILTYEDYLGATIKAMTPDGELALQIPEDMLIPKNEVDNVGACGALGAVTTIIDVNKFNSVLGANLFKIPGTYVFYSPNGSEYISSLSKSEISKIDEKYLPDSIDNRFAKLEGKIITAIFNVASKDTTIELQNLEGMAKIDWGDGTIDNLTKHTYKQVGEYRCKIYGVTTIGRSAFASCNSLTSVEIPNSVTSIDDYAFSYCTSLTRVEIGGGVTAIGTWAFYGCTSLTSVVIGDSVTSIGDDAFYSCTSLTSVVIPDSVTTIGNSAFYECSSLTSVVIPDSVTKIDDQAFTDCSSLTSVTIGNGVTYIGYNVFWKCTSLTSITIPDSVTSIGEAAFLGCSGLTSVTIGNGVTSIGNRAFYGCSGLTEITLPFVGASKAATGYESVFGYIFGYSTIGYGSSSIPDATYQYSSGSTYYHYYIPTSLKKVTITGGDIGSYVFRNCSNLTSVVIPDSVTSIGNYAFSGCSGLTSVTIPDSVTQISDQAFSGCSRLTSITIPDSVTSIGLYAFRDCSRLTSVVIPDSVTSIGVSVFSGCQSLTEIAIPFVGYSKKTPNDTYQYPFGYIFGYYSYTGSTKIRQEYYGSSISSPTYTDFYIPTALKKVTVTGGNILYGAFSGCSGLTSITIPDSVTSIGNSAFKGCLGLTSVVIPDSVTSIGNDAFNDCRGLTSVVIPDSVMTIGYCAFYSCDSLTSVAIGNGVTSIGKMAFDGCTSLTKVVIPDSVTSIGDGAFEYCTSLMSIVIPDSITLIDESMFWGCSSLTNISLPNSIINIMGCAFAECSSLTSIIIPKSVTFLGESVFLDCGESLKGIIFKNPIPVGYTIFNGEYPMMEGLSSTTKIYVPYGCKQAYLDKWAADGAEQSVLDKIVESDRDATMADINTLKAEIQAELIGKTDYLGTVAAMTDLSTIAGAGDYHRVSTEFVYDESTGEIAHVGDILIAVKDNPTQSKDDWDLVHTELGATPATSEDINALFEEA